MSNHTRRHRQRDVDQSQLRRVAELASVLQGCHCDREIRTRRRDRVTVAHDVGCPLRDAGPQVVLFERLP